jgi:signal transduction histidine kinase
MAETRGRAGRDGSTEVPTVNLGVRPPVDPLALVAVADPLERAALARVLAVARVRQVEVLDAAGLPTAVVDLRPDLILLDAALPPDGALAVCRQLKASAVTHLVPVIVIGDGADRAARLAAMGAGADHFLARPIDVEELAVRCRTLLRTRGLVRVLEDRRHGLRLRTEFSRFLVHDLRNPLGAALANLEVLGLRLAGPTTGDGDAAVLADAIHALHRVSALVQDLLDLDRFERGQLLPRPATFALSVILEGLLGRFRLQATQAGIPLLLAGAPDAEVTADPALLERVFSNLLDNALHHAPRGLPIVVRVVAAASTVQVRVLNHGPAVPAAERTRIFEPFVRIGREQATSGAGLGLAFCRQAVEAHGGSIGVEDDPSGGVAFVVTLPQVGARPAAGPAPS